MPAPPSPHDEAAVRPGPTRRAEAVDAALGVGVVLLARLLDPAGALAHRTPGTVAVAVLLATAVAVRRSRPVVAGWLAAAAGIVQLAGARPVLVLLPGFALVGHGRAGRRLDGLARRGGLDRLAPAVTALATGSGAVRAAGPPTVDGVLLGLVVALLVALAWAVGVVAGRPGRRPAGG